MSRRNRLSGLKVILLDLDDTLLYNDMDIFLRAYLKLLGAYMADHYDPQLFIKQLMAATDAMIGNDDKSKTNEDAFWDEFSRLTGFDREEMVPFFHRFYQTRFNEIQALTKSKPEARPFVEWAFKQGLKVVIATNPLFPMVAVEQRLRWAGIAVDEFDYELVTCYENMHAAKPNPAYYQEILEKISCQPSDGLMVGDDLQRDIEPAAGVGLLTYWVKDGNLPDNRQIADGIGSLKELEAWLQGN